MADLQKTIEIVFGGVDKTGGAISSVGQGLDSLTGRVGSLTGPLANITDSIVKLDTALAAAAIGVTGYAIKIADDFDTAFSEIATLIGQPADNLRDFQAQILSYSEQSSASLDEITQATYSAISAGIDYQNSLELIAAAEQLSIAGRADLGETTVALVSTLNAFGAEANQAGEYADHFFTAVRLGQTTIPELASSIGTLAPIAAAAGLDFSEMAAAIATITAETGTGTAEAITGIRAAISALLKPSSEAAALAEELGIEFNAAALESKGFSGVLSDVAQATGGNTEQLAVLFGRIQALAPVLALTGNASDAFASNLAAMSDNAGAAGIAANELQNDLGRIVQTLQNNLNAALIGFGSNLTSETQSIVRSVSGIFNSIGQEIRLDDGVFAPIIGGIEGLAQDIDQKLQAVAANFPEALSGIQFNDLLAAFGDLGDELGDLFTGLFGDVDLSTVEGLQEALQKVVDAFTALVNVSAGIANGLEPLFEGIGKGIEEFQKLDDSTKKSIGDFLGLAKAIDTVLPLIGGMAGGLQSVGSGLTALAGAQGFKALLGNLGELEKMGKVGKGGLIGFALAGGYAIGEIINETIINPLEEKFGTSIGSWLYEYFNADELEKIEKLFGGVTGELSDTAKETAELRDLNDRLALSLDNTRQAAELDIGALNERASELVRNANEQQKLNGSLDSFAGSQGGVNSVLSEVAGNANAGAEALGNLSRFTQNLAENNRSLSIGYDETTGKANSFSGAIVRSSSALSEAGQKAEDAIAKTEQYYIEMEKIASNERIANIEATVSLNIAEVEAGAKKVEALSKSISETFGSTGDVITELFGLVGDRAPGWREIQNQIRKENDRRDEALKLQKQLTQAEIDQIKARTLAIKKGDSLIKVDGSGLQPHLEAFMFEILRAIQVRVNQDGEALLLGVG